jgi:colicin import membrane protein
MDRKDTEGLKVKAEEWITDQYALNKKGTKLSRISGKFRRKTIDRKDNIFERIDAALGIK